MVQILGKVDNSQELLAVLEYLRRKCYTCVSVQGRGRTLADASSFVVRSKSLPTLRATSPISTTQAACATSRDSSPFLSRAAGRTLSFSVVGDSSRYAPFPPPFSRGADALSQHIRWGGNPYKNTPGIDGAAALEPRKSFRAWSETVIGKCKSWTDEQQDTPQVLLLIYGKVRSRSRTGGLRACTDSLSVSSSTCGDKRKVCCRLRDSRTSCC